MGVIGEAVSCGTMMYDSFANENAKVVEGITCLPTLVSYAVDSGKAITGCIRLR